MQHVLHLLDTSIITPPSGSDLETQHTQLVQPESLESRQPTPENICNPASHRENSGKPVYNDLGEVIDLLGSLDANESYLVLQHQQEQLEQVDVGNLGSGLPPSAASSIGASQKVQLPRSTSASTIHSGLDYISPIGLLNGSSMSPATISWLQTLIPSTSTESLTGLISPATLYTAGSGSSSSVGGIGGITGGAGCSTQVDEFASTKGDELPRISSSDIIDWKAYNESCADKVSKGRAKWRVIPQHGPHAADPVANANSGKLPPGCTVSSHGPTAIQPSTRQHRQLTTQEIADDKNKRKALVSPEYVQYGNQILVASSSMPQTGSSGIEREAGSVQYGTKVREPAGRRPFKKALHEGNGRVEATLLHQQRSVSSVSTASQIDGKDDVMRCKCTGKCRNARCACVKAGLVCGVQCKCVLCANPFIPMAREGIDIQLVVSDKCMMQHLSKIKDMQELLDSTISYECCEEGGGVVQVKHTVENGFACPYCDTQFTYSWCNNRLCPDSKKPRRHCAKCRRCGDHRNLHCDLCNHCYFAGVANSFRCSCQLAGSGNGAKTRAVVPNPVIRETGLIKRDQKDGQKCELKHYDAASNGCARMDIDINKNSKVEAEDEAETCKVQ